MTEEEEEKTMPHPVVLLVDDQVIVSEAIRRMLADDKGIKFHYCQDPSKAVHTANEVKPTVILQDLIMPDVDGYTLLKFYRGNPATAATPVIVLSTKEDPMAKRQAFENGANDYLVKLPDKIELIARIRAHSETYLLQLQRDEAYREMEKLQEELKKSNALLQRLSVLDGLTGISNRRHFDEMLDQEWKRAVREKLEIALVLLDIDFFKKYNDGYGHQDGDDCLKQVASTLYGTIQRTSDFLARYGGEEFVAILPGTDVEGAVKLAEEMRANVEKKNIPHAYSDVANHISISLGIAVMQPDMSDKPEFLLAKADDALYKAKEEGRNRYILAE